MSFRLTSRLTTYVNTNQITMMTIFLDKCNRVLTLDRTFSWCRDSFLLPVKPVSQSASYREEEKIIGFPLKISSVFVAEEVSWRNVIDLYGILHEILLKAFFYIFILSVLSEKYVKIK